MHLGRPDVCLPHGKHADLLKQCNLDSHGIETSIRKKLKEIA